MLSSNLTPVWLIWPSIYPIRADAKAKDRKYSFLQNIWLPYEHNWSVDEIKGSFKGKQSLLLCFVSLPLYHSLTHTHNLCCSWVHDKLAWFFKEQSLQFILSVYFYGYQISLSFEGHFQMPFKIKSGEKILTIH